MKRQNNVGDLVHLPQSTVLICYKNADRQKTIPFNTTRLEEPKLALISGKEHQGYIPIYWEGRQWTVRAEDVYIIEEK